MEGMSTRLVQYAAADESFRFHHARDEHPNPQDYKLHYEKGCEIYMFISGSGSFNIEGTRYELEPYSILLMNSNELHVLNISGLLPYERVVLSLNENMLPPFLLNGIDIFRTIKFRKLGHGNQIKADSVQSSGLLGLFIELQKLLVQKNAENEFVAKCVIVQILHAVNRIAETEETPRTVGKVKPKAGALLEYINANLNEELCLDSLSEKFFVSKYHLCRTFKEATGYSINQYITFKRIRLADELMLEGYSPTQACFMSGFNNYSNFFKSYRKLIGKAPRNGKSK